MKLHLLPVQLLHRMPTNRQSLAAVDGAAEGVRDFLASRHCRNLADDVQNGIHVELDLTAAIEVAITRLMG